MILYYSSTGNSEYVARAVADKLGDNQIVDLFDYIKGKKAGEFNSDTPYVIAFPVYLATMPKMVREVMLRSKFNGNNDFYYIATCNGSESSSSANDTLLVTKKLGKNWKGCFTVQMPQNYISLFSPTPEDEQKNRWNNALTEASKIADVIREGKTQETALAGAFMHKITKATEKLYYKCMTSTKKFYATDKCKGCGACVRMCPLNNITLKDGKPQWIGSCTHCMSCLNKCPFEAVEVGNKTQGKQRYTCIKYKKEE